MLCHGASEESAIHPFRLHELTIAHDLQGEREHANPPTLSSQPVFLSLSPGRGWLWHRQDSNL